MAIPAAATERAEQIPLIEDPGLWRARSIDLPALQQSYADLRQRQTHAPETRRNYQSDWEQFTAWCTDAVRSPLPASDETIAMYALYCGQTSGHTVSTIERRLSAIRKLHRDAGFPSPTGEHVRQVVRLLKREKGTRPKQKTAILPDQLREILRAIDGSTPRGARNRAIMVLGFATGARRSELAALELADVSFVKQGVRVLVRRSKTDQQGAGREICVFRGSRPETCPVRVLRAWLRFRGEAAGPLFTRLDTLASDLLPMTGHSIRSVVQRCVELAGMDPTEYAGHSLRAGMITAAAMNGAPDSVVMQRSGHKSVTVYQRYVRQAKAFAFDPLAKAL